MFAKIRQSVAFLAGGVAITAAAVGAAAVADTGAEPDTTPVTSEVSQAAADATFLIECVEDNVVNQPRTFTLSCADANEVLDNLTWTNWGADEATASGVVASNDCDPNCAEGEMKSYPVTVVASDLVQGEASQTYGTLTVVYSGDRPEGAEQTETVKVQTVEAISGLDQ
ncbi:MAG: hypothetical protein V9G04_09320 [Nocardioides sp.]|jgi:hypothetical protein